MATAQAAPAGPYGLMAEFEDPSALVAAAKRTYEAGYRNIDTFSPYPIEEAWEAIGRYRCDRLNLVALRRGGDHLSKLCAYRADDFGGTQAIQLIVRRRLRGFLLITLGPAELTLRTAVGYIENHKQYLKKADQSRTSFGMT